MPTFFTRPDYIPFVGFAVVDVANAAARLALPQLAAVGRVVSQADTASVWALKPGGLAANAADWRCIGASAIASDNPPGSSEAASAMIQVVSAGVGTVVSIGSRNYMLANRRKQVCLLVLSGFCTSSGNVTVTVTGALITSPQVFSVAVQAHDSGVAVAGKIKTALEVPSITGAYTPSLSAGMLALTANVAAANDPTLAMAFTNGHGIPDTVSGGYGGVPGNSLAPDTVFADPDPAAVVANLVAAINGGVGAGVVYGSGTLPHEDGTAAASVDGSGYAILTFTANEVGSAGNAIPVTSTISNGGVVGPDHLTGSVDGTPAALLGQDCIVNEESFYKCVSLSPVRWVGPFPSL